MSLVGTLRFIASHPLNATTSMGRLAGIARFFRWQLMSRIASEPISIPFVEHSRLSVRRGMHGATGNIYCGLQDFADMAFVLHLLREGDLFVDVGANVGSYTVLASGVVGVKSLAIEPIPSTFSHLLSNLELNRLHEKVTALNIGIASADGTIQFIASSDTTNHVATAQERAETTIEVAVSPLDGVLSRLRNPHPALVKIDVEGFETEVIAGAERSLSNPSLLAVIIELNGQGSRYGHDDEDVHRRLLKHGFAPYVYKPFERTLIPLQGHGHSPDRVSDNTLYIRDIALARDRVQSARRYRVLHHWL